MGPFLPTPVHQKYTSADVCFFNDIKITDYSFYVNLMFSSQLLSAAVNWSIKIIRTFVVVFLADIF